MRTDIVIIGAGIIGLSIARALTALKRETVVLESESRMGTHSSSRNSEVIHAGFYCPPESEKASACIRGNALLQEYCLAHGVPYRMVGKVVVAQNLDEMARLEDLAHQGRQAGVPQLKIIDSKVLEKLEPELVGEGALWSQNSGIVDSHRFMESMKSEFENAGGIVAFESPVIGGRSGNDGFEIEVGGREPVTMVADHVINAAGLMAPQVARTLGFDTDQLPESRWVKGHYFSYQGPSPLKRLVYPLPSPDGLGIHATLNLDGRLRFGPDTLEVTSLDYQVPAHLRGKFSEAIQRYWPGFDADLLAPDYAGIRSKIVLNGKTLPDFQIVDHRLRRQGVISLLGIESPGLTASLALGESILRLLR